MKISWNWLSELVDLSSVGTPEKFADLMIARGLEVEAIERMDKGLEKVITAQILVRDKHPQADRLSLCKVSTGSGEPLEIVCGAQNMKAGDKVALAQVGADLPNGIKIALSKIRGVTSNGMLCSLEELKLNAPGEESEGIIILPSETELGQPLAKVLGRNDTILHFKLTANRGDCLSHFGMAREAAAALGVKPKRPQAPTLDFAGSPISVDLQAGESAPQFFGCTIEGVKVGPSPDWVVKRLESLGTRAINNVVDATNLLLLELGQPVHAYDADRIEGKKIGVRIAKQGEKLPLLDGTEVTLAGSELVIFDGGRAVGLAGVMGGGNSEVQDSTTRVFLECAEFAPGLIRRASSKHQKKTEAAHRFERGVDPEGQSYAIARLAQLVTQLAGGTIKGSVKAQLPRKSARPTVALPQNYMKDFLGMDVPAERVQKILENLECKVEAKAGSWLVTPPSYRLDLSIKEDLAEEVARTIGYDAIPETIPTLSSDPAFGASARPRLDLINRAKDAMTEAGFNEVLNFSWASKAWLEKFGMKSSAVVLNPLSEEHEALVPSLLPNLIKTSLDNWHHHFGSEPLAIRLFELRPVFEASGAITASGEMETNVREKWRLAIALSGPRVAGGLRKDQGEVDFYDFKAVIENLFETLGTRGVRFQPLSASRTGGNPLMHPGQSVEILAGKDVAGSFGLIHPSKSLELKLRAPLWIAEIDWDAIAHLALPAKQPRGFKSWSEFPSIERDFALVVKDEITADKITQVAAKAGKPLAKVVKVFDIYRGSQVAEGMTSVAVRVIFYEEGRSLQESEAEAASALILNAWKKELGAELRS